MCNNMKKAIEIVDIKSKPKVEIIAYTQDAEKIIATAAKLCYSKSSIIGIKDIFDDEKTKKFLNMLMGLGHGSVLEHVNFTFAIEDISRVTEIQLLRKRTGSPSVQSGRYVFRDKAKYYIPNNIKNDKELCEKYINSITESQRKYLMLVDLMMEKGYDEKEAIEDARYVQPQSLCTNMLFTIDLRNLIDLIKLRKCKRAQREIRELIIVIEELLKDILPNISKFIGAPCEIGGCHEGKMSCKNPYKKVVE